MTICEKCGAARQSIPEACPSCGFRPHALRDLAIAALLTDQFDAGSEAWGTEPAALEQVARAIRRGTRPAFDEAQLARHETAVRAFLEEGPVPPLPVALFMVFRPAIVFIGVLLLVWLGLRFLLR